MIKADELREFRPVVRYRDGNQITLQTVQEAIKDCAQGMGIPVAFYTDQVKSGGMFNKTIEDCIVLYHPEHQYDYFKICVRVSHQGSYAFVSAMDFGTSKQMKKAGQAEAYRADRKGKSMSYKVGSSRLVRALPLSAEANLSWKKNRITMLASSISLMKSFPKKSY